jgi:iron(II)-dependent oxidoreductase
VTIVTRGRSRRLRRACGRRTADTVRTLDKADLRDGLLAAHEYTKAMLADLADEQLIVPRLPIVNPLLWEYGHVGWFTERFCLRWQSEGRPPPPPLLADADRWYDSSAVAHDSRWTLDLPGRARTEQYVRQVLEATLVALDRAEDSDAGLYLFRLALYHEDMHAEAFSYMRHTLGLPAPAVLAGAAPPEVDARAGDAELAGGRFALGALRGPGFVFDNEKWSHDVELLPFAIARNLVSNAEFAAFVDDGGYRRDELWSAAGRAWRDATGRRLPRDWRRDSGGLSERRYDRWQPIRAADPVRHVTAHEAEAYCRWRGRRLPSEAQWELAAVSGAIASLGLWEWTASTFAPYPGFAADAYADYSAPWFGTHRVLRGASFATPARLRHPRFRNFFLPERDDIFVGFRTCAVA